MTVENLPHWTFLPNWRQPVNEALTWNTVVLGSRTGAEQRFGVRWSPRRSFEALFTPTGVSRTHFDLAVGKVGIDPWYVPVWHDVTRLSSTLSSGASSLAIDTDYREFKAGGFVMLRADEFTSEVLEIDTIAGGAIEFVDGPSQDWPEGTLVFPALKARITDQPSMTRFASRAFENALRFEVVGENDFTGAEAAETTYLSYPVLTVGPNEALDLTHAYARLFDELDSDTGLLDRVHTSDIGFTVQGHNWRALDRQQHAELRSYFYALAGRTNPTWVPTFAEDFYLALPVSSGATSITVRKCGFVAFGGPRTGRQDIEIVLKDGTALRRRISGAAYDDQGREVISLTASIGQNIAVVDVARISFMSLSRLDTDTIEFTHHTDNRGVCDVAATFRSVPDIRDAADWAPSLPNNTVQTAGACGDVCTPGIALGGNLFLVAAGAPSGSAPFTFIGNADGPGTGYGFAVGFSNGSAKTPYVAVGDLSGESASTPAALDGSTGGEPYSYDPGGAFVARLLGGGYISVQIENAGATGDDELIARRVDDSGALIGSRTSLAGGTAPGLRGIRLFGLTAASDPGRYAFAYHDSNTNDLKIGLRSNTDVAVFSDVTVLTSSSVFQFGLRGLFRFPFSETYVLVYMTLDGVKYRMIENTGTTFTVGSEQTLPGGPVLAQTPTGYGAVYSEGYPDSTMKFVEIASDGSLSTPINLYDFTWLDGFTPERTITAFSFTAGGALVAMEAVYSISGSVNVQYRATLFAPGTLAEIESVNIGNPQVFSYTPTGSESNASIVRSASSGEFAAVLRLQDAGWSDEEDVSIYAIKINASDCTDASWPNEEEE